MYLSTVVFHGVKKFLLILCGVLIQAHAHSQYPSDSLLREQLTRAVAFWKDGRALNAFLALDSINGTGIIPQNAATKTRAAYWTGSYLLAQRKLNAAVSFTDSAMVWTERFNLGDELIRVLSLKAKLSEARGNKAEAARIEQAIAQLTDSLKTAPLLHTIDSLQRRVSALEQSAPAEPVDVKLGQKSAGTTTLTLVLSCLCAVLFCTTVYFYRKGQSRESHSQTGSSIAPRREPVPITTPGHVSGGSSAVGNKLKSTPEAEHPSSPPAEPNAPLFIPVVQEQKSKAAPSESHLSTLPPAGNIPQETFNKLKGVELVLIKAEVLATYRGGEIKAIRNLLNEFIAQLPFFMKTLDDAIAQNEIAPILLALNHAKDYLRQFGMASTEKLIDEIEMESSTEKISRLLSKVFQVRNHCRRAADETKSILAHLG
jgi:polyhydroxyalkanoate synthesis regulator phasin